MHRQNRKIKCSECNREHAEPDCRDRPYGRGPWCKFPQPEGACEMCWYGFGKHTYRDDCDLVQMEGDQ